MKKYTNILLAVELDPKSDSRVLKEGQMFGEHYNAPITLLNVVEHLSNYGAAYGVSAGIDIEEILINEAKITMRKLGDKLNVPESRQLVKVGPAAQVIIDVAKERNIDLIVLGSHGRHGVRLLLGSTANGVLHGAHCDVLAVRLKD